MSEDNDQKPRYATLIRGRYYDFEGLIWNRDEDALTHQVSAEQEAYLTKNAYDPITVDGEEHRRPKFEFHDDEPEEEEPLPKPRRRARQRVAAS